MARKCVKRALTGRSDPGESKYEIRNREVARKAAADGMVLLKNENGVLPLNLEEPVALYGSGAVKTIKGGSGSGDVNAREIVSIWEGMERAGYRITTRSWLSQYRKEYEEARITWRESFWMRAEALPGGLVDNGPAAPGFFELYSSFPFEIPAGRVPDARDEGDQAEKAVVVLSRMAGEGRDRRNEPGDYLLSEEELDLVHAVCRLYRQVVLVLNSGLVDLGFLEDSKCANIDGILYIHQPGMEAGSAFADVVSGRVNPSAKLTDTWARSYGDYPNAESYSYLGVDPGRERYTEGIYVGYRYFDTFQKPVQYGFGYGLSYTSFSIQDLGLEKYGSGSSCPEIGIRVRVRNEGDREGREVVQIYASCPQEKREKEFRRLAGYGKTSLLRPGEAQEMEIRVPLYQLSSFQEDLPGWVLESGKYILMYGSSLQNSQAAGVLTVAKDQVFCRLEHICPLKEELEELKQDGDTAASGEARRKHLLEEVEREGKPELRLGDGEVLTEQVVYDGAYEDTPREVREFVDSLSLDQMVELAAGKPTKKMGALEDHSEDAADEKGRGEDVLVPGSSAQTSACAEEKGLPAIVLSDGPAGLHLSRCYRVVDGTAQPTSSLESMEGGFLIEGRERGKKSGEYRYQYCTAFPTGTELAQSWDPEVLRSVGRAAGEELREYGVTLWLAPGMNIHRNPLCGRNFEYYSEDPLIAGLSSAAVVEGAQSVEGIGATVKHFACNNQEDNRMGRDSILSERALREIYLKGFEICIRKAQPRAVMTSYNLVNGVHAANSYDLCTKTARSEWGFQGLIMTDWTTTMVGPDCTASGCMRAGNDLIMPGAESDHQNIRKELAEGTLPLGDLKRSIARLVNIVWQSNFSVQD